MPTTRGYVRSFGGGEVTPEFFGRFDDAKHQTGLQKCRNAIVKPHGPVTNRGGLRYVNKAKNPLAKARIIPFKFADDQSFVIEMGDGYFRFHTLGATVLAPAADAWDSGTAYVQGDLVTDSGTVYYCLAPHTNQAPPNATYWYAIPSTAYEIPHPYGEDDIFAVKLTQSNDIITMTHPGYPPAELRRYAATDWRYIEIEFGSILDKPTNIRATAKRGETPGTPTTQSYVVTAVTGADESAPSG